MDDVFYFPHDPSQPVNFSSSSSFTSSSYEFNDSISQSMSISSSYASNRLTNQNISTFSGPEARRSQNTSTAFSYASDRLISQNISSPSVSEVGYEAFQFFLSYLYTGELNPPPLEVSTCVDEECAHEACRPAIDFTVDLMYASSIFNLPELVVHFQGRLVNFADKAYVEDVIPILLAAFHCQSDELVNQCVGRIARSDLDSISIEKELPYEFSKRIELSRKKPMSDDEQVSEAVEPLHEKAIRKIHKALDWDDIELVKLLLWESNVTLDDANSLHYAVAYCDSKVVRELLHLGFTDVNRRNSQGYTPLHIAAMRREPSIIVSLLIKGASASVLTFDGRSALSICRRLTSIKNYNDKTEQGQVTNEDQLCIDILETEMRRNPMADDASITSQDAVDDTFDFKLWLKL
ncbi:BTB/POZ domain and ankyrin repeat-containing protein NPR1-like isoform X3 [Hevea brasiliensis]|uniref:BTB/POZ domain and ankyrin repeat-containing protein NPR1-like isoform X3 n=1 Tax=Hevea brasiliensis TaxID=3981 RepID=UPI0025D84F48|nr:BTB/POZ domain and ankyrin repeat-containing protein NPR1-like isoform X3 [Hevea brasiliensis]